MWCYSAPYIKNSCKRSPRVFFSDDYFFIECFRVYTKHSVCPGALLHRSHIPDIKLCIEKRKLCCRKLHSVTGNQYIWQAKPAEMTKLRNSTTQTDIIDNMRHINNFWPLGMNIQNDQKVPLFLGPANSTCTLFHDASATLHSLTVTFGGSFVP